MTTPANVYEHNGEEEEGSTDKMPDSEKSSTKSSFFNDEHGNLKFVNIFCRYPVLIFSIVFTICIGSTFILGLLVSQTGNPITEDTAA
jgi:hypothetical protein